MKKNLTEVVFILDRSGSMSGLEKDVVGGFNSTIKEQKKDNKGKSLISTVLFNSYSKVIHDRVPIEEIEDMKLEDYSPNGSTALIDALGDSIKYIKKVHKIIRKEDVPNHTLFIITTDGEENSSHKYSSNEVKNLITKQQEEGWEFIYLAANIDAVETSKKYGFRADRSHNFVNDSKGNKEVYSSVSKLMTVVTRCDENAKVDIEINKANVFDKLDKDYKKRKK